MVVVNPVTVYQISFREALSRNFESADKHKPYLWKDRGGGGGGGG